MDSSFLKLEPNHDPRKMLFETQAPWQFWFRQEL